MKIGIIGAGFVGRAISKLALKAGHQVMLSNSRDPKTLFTLTRTTQCQAGTPQQAAEFGDIVVIAIPLEAYRSVPAAPLVGKVVIDANNYYPDRDGRIPELDQHQTTTSEMLAKHLPESRIIKAFNAIRMDDLLNDGLPASAAERRALPIAGDDAQGKALVTALLDEFGFDVVDAGGLAEGWRFEAGTPVYCVPLNQEQLKAGLQATAANHLA
ncbi:MAG: NAD(P)-binding domain-containing protein [Ewingella americana]|jgi:predicted dinucleotide-binding enzyme|uniref:NADPH-dependent F420 reductase n=1 Tax=Ewingella americana TaxID=41202 RepID=UPI00243111B0|nr:NAD(P)-binding domain-containing protein [Ewingella americana]MCI1678310.1 NAD(P)-binding domain-containing protein [Ewingella americana]MCI1856053.1 NAD(P)-binding domain-containing protein [Ewingella americana]MCI1862278.1 NAD(P)-binding domain-containing protein [Ewingella americana]MCI2142769.1 NAD(P)-binding domain-containing protein [Ewingella americana]MCI2162560.1 NAD(P)-binding domain-containing protein [Ewingella americana]